MQFDIANTIQKIEKEERIKILFLSDYGSRAKGYDRPDSDFDVCGIYVEDSLDTHWERQIFPKHVDHIVRTDQSGDATVDLQLWHLCKALRLLFANQNYTLTIWCKSSIIYAETAEWTAFRAFLDEQIKVWHCAGIFGFSRSEFKVFEQRIQRNEVPKAYKSLLTTWYQLLLVIAIHENGRVESIRLLDLLDVVLDKKYDEVAIDWTKYVISKDEMKSLMSILRTPDQQVDIEPMVNKARMVIDRMQIVAFKERRSLTIEYDERWKRMLSTLLPH